MSENKWNNFNKILQQNVNNATNLPNIEENMFIAVDIISRKIL